MFGLGTTELMIILLIVVVLFGASRLPELGKGLGQGMRSFRDALRSDNNERKDIPNDNPKEIDDKHS